MKVAVIYNERRIRESDVVDFFGPPTRERYNRRTVERVAAALEKGGHNVKVIKGNIDVGDELRQFMPRVLAGERPGMVFNMAYGIQGQSRYTHIPALLEMLGVPYVGSGPRGHAVALDKVLSKIVFQQHDIPTPLFWVFTGADDEVDEVIYPVIVKPKMEAVSMGIRIVDNDRDLREAVVEVLETFHQPALVEQFIAGREFAVGLLGNGAEMEVLPIVEFDLPTPEAIQTAEAKMKEPVEKICPARVPEDSAREMQRIALAVFHSLELHDFARVDLRMSDAGTVYVLEANSMASLGATGSYARAAGVAGYDYEALVNRMLDVAALRYFGRSHLEIAQAPRDEPGERQPLRVRIRGYIRSREAAMEDDLRHMVGMNTCVHNAEGVNALGNWLSRKLTRLGFDREVHPQAEVGNIVFLANHAERENDVLLLANLDNFYRYEDLLPYRRERGGIFGSGVAESKGGLAVMLASLRALRFARRLKRIRCGILLTPDSSLGNRFSRDLIAEIGSRSRHAVGLRYGDPDGGVVLSSSGSMAFDIEMSNIKDAGSAKDAPNVVTTMCRKVVAWTKLGSAERDIRVRPRSLKASTPYGAAPDFAACSLTVRYRSADDAEGLEREIRRIAGRNLKGGATARVRKHMDRPPVAESEASRAFFERVEKAARRLEIRIQAVHRGLTSDLAYVPAGTPALEGLGPLGLEPRSPHEHILRNSLLDRAVLMAMVLRQCASTPNDSGAH